MSEPPDDLETSPEVWLRYAGDDLTAGERALLAPPLPAVVCFHAQQAAEKALKAYLLHLGEERIPRTHNLSRLAASIEAHEASPPPPAPLIALSAYGAATRYPDLREPTAEQAEEALRLAHEVLAFVRAQLTPPQAPPANEAPQ